MPFEHCIIISNPTSTQAEQAKFRIKDLLDLFGAERCTVLETSPKGRRANLDLLFMHANNLGSQTLLAIVAGDGTTSMYIEALLRDRRSTARIRKTVVLPLWGGNGNDLSHMLNGPSRRLSTRRMLQSGQTVAIRPLECRLSLQGDETVHVAASYASFGASAYTAHQLEKLRGQKFRSHAFRATQFTHELGLVVRSMAKAPLFEIKDGDTVRPVYERIFVNGSRFAKVDTVPLKLTDDAFCEALVEQKKLLEVTQRAMELIRKSTVSQTKHKNAVNFSLRDDTWAQFDGEIVRLKAGTDVRIARSPQQFYAWSTVLKA